MPPHSRRPRWKLATQPISPPNSTAQMQYVRPTRGSGEGQLVMAGEFFGDEDSYRALESRFAAARDG